MHRTEESVRLSYHTSYLVLTYCEDIGMCISISVSILSLARRLLDSSYE